jgi:hypothetical protein
VILRNLMTVVGVSALTFAASANTSIKCESSLKVSDSVSFKYEMISDVDLENEGSTIKLVPGTMDFNVYGSYSNNAGLTEVKHHIQDAAPVSLGAYGIDGSKYRIRESAYGIEFIFRDPGPTSDYAPSMQVFHRIDRGLNMLESKASPCRIVRR